MKITVKLFALLGRFLPPNARANQIEMDAPPDASPESILTGLGVPLEQCHLVLVNGVYIEPSARANASLKEGDVLAVWPPIAGG